MKAARVWSAASTWNVGRRAPILCGPGWGRVARGSASSSRNCEALSTDAGRAGGPARSSGEALVMGVERRGRLIRGLFARATGRCPGRRSSEQVEVRQDKSFDISKRLVWEAYKQRQGEQGCCRGGRAVDRGLRKDLKNNLYKIWNRMSSGTYFPPPVRAVEIPKPHGGGTRMLGIPTVADRIAQTVVALQSGCLGRSPIFHDDSYGYRPKRSRAGCGGDVPPAVLEEGLGAGSRHPEVLRLVDHDLMVKAVEANTDQKWVVLYVKRWLNAPIQMPDGRPGRAGSRNPAGVGGLTRPGEPLHARVPRTPERGWV